jgi:hypothetical protein
MSDDTTEEPLTPAEQRVQSLLAGFRAQPVPGDPGLPQRIGRNARWQQPVRRALLTVGTTADALAGGLRSLIESRRG